jgi:Leucine-rich repeat (LRR) protein
MQRFPNLNDLNLSFNQIVDLDILVYELAKLKNLSVLDLRANKFNMDHDYD